MFPKDRFLKRAICLVVDLLHAGYLGPYGNTWVQTPALNHLASEAVLFDRAIADSPDLQQTYRAYWTGVPTAHQTATSQDDAQSLIAKCREQGIATVLITDDAMVHDHPLAADFSQRMLIELGDTPDAADLSAEVADDWQATALAEFFAAAIENITTLDAQVGDATPVMYWLHTGVLGRVWDAPAELGDQYADEDDPAPPSLIDPPRLRLAADADPDQILGIRHAYAGQVTLLDRCLQILIAALEEQPSLCDAMFVLTSPRSYPLGEHGQVGLVNDDSTSDALHGELLRVPLVVRMPAAQRIADRSQQLVCSADLYATLTEWFELAIESPADLPAISVNLQPIDSLGARSLLPLFDPDRKTPVPSRDYLLAIGANEHAVVTPGWFLRVASRDTGQQLELYVKPDDYYEVNDVADRCREVAEELAALAGRVIDQDSSDTTALPALSDDARLGLHGSRLP